ncbi:MAG: imidazoleglycerol-phosphate dehydratase HisB [Ignavibacteria bacterium]|nr:imidazoleglycerol-phosphate dehydratase HisB [Ignavibacteria bacterium]
MKKIIQIKKDYLDFSNPLSISLISGLLKLSKLGFVFQVDDNSFQIEKSLTQIFQNENIAFTPEAKRKPDFVIADKYFSEAVNDILLQLRSAKQHRKTKETDITVLLSLEGKGETNISTGIGFFDHMLEQIAKHANINLDIKVIGDLHIDEHHTVEDVGITLGSALSEALGNKSGIKRYGFYLPMDDTIAKCALDLGGRTYLNFKCNFKREKVGDLPVELTEEFFRGLASTLKANIYLRAKGKNDHHKIEALFKVFAKALNEACRIDERAEGSLPTTKGIL